MSSWYESIPVHQFIGEKSGNSTQKCFWSTSFILALASFIFASYMLVADFEAKTTRIVSEDRHASLDDVYFPSLVVCNINDFRYSFVNFIIENLKKDGKMKNKDGPGIQTTEEEQAVYDLIRGYFLKGIDRNLTVNEETLKMTIFQSEFYKDYIHRFLATTMKKTMNISLNSIVHSYSKIQESSLHSNGKMKEQFYDDIVGIIASQWEEGQKIVNLEWNGDITSERSHVYIEQNFGTSDGVCSWVTPLMEHYNFSIEDFTKLKKGAYFGQNNGLDLFLDTESYDYVQNEGEGLGFKLAVTHPLDMPIIQGASVNIKPGFMAELGISTTTTEASSSSLSRFKAYDRKCWHSSEINLKYLPYEEGYHYSFSNCLFVATLQEAAKLCNCVPGFIELDGNSCFGMGLKCFNNVFKNLGKYMRE